MELRPWRKQDAAALAVIANNPNIANNVSAPIPSPYTMKDAMEWIGHISQQKPMQNFAILVDGLVVGNMGAVLKEEMSKQIVEIGYFVAEPHWGKGIASKALSVFLSYVEQTFHPTSIFATVFEQNKASTAVLSKNGFQLSSIKPKTAIKNGLVMDEQVWVKLIKP